MYSPKIKQDLVTKLYKVGKATHKPMTQVVDGILRDYVGKIQIKEWKIHWSEGLSPHTNITYTVSKKKSNQKYSGAKQ